MSIKFAVESFEQCWEDMQPLFKRHKEELSTYEDSILAPNVEVYKQAHKMGRVLFLTIRDDYKLVGYAIYFVDKHLHYTGETWAGSDILIIMPEYRRLNLGDPFMSFIETACRDFGAQKIQTTVRISHPQGRALGMLLVHRGNLRKDVTYIKRLD
jgi:GNAT superfamily N-acetyltransferase